MLETCENATKMPSSSIQTALCSNAMPSSPTPMSSNTANSSRTHMPMTVPDKITISQKLSQCNNEKQPAPSSSRRASKEHWIKPCLTLENSGSVARDHLASERTFLAYVRTSLLMASIGVALVQLFMMASLNSIDNATPMEKWSRPLGATFVVFSLLILIIGLRRYFLIQHALVQGRFPVTRFSIALISAVALILSVVVFGVLVTKR